MRKVKLLLKFLPDWVIYRLMRAEPYCFIVTKLKTMNLAFN
ncbi:hypothetical protein AQPE_4760 [Aquipluma nitroreducens]|uniref:Uncharacterized protein n=1 Tax=Aquipluma nitroreducens TaxID=2010828 RepID=A0A5K7SGE8_9BACT|nr:hypothetical protein AQPE_4760 [Aquipluma nitroreducens]